MRRRVLKTLIKVFVVPSFAWNNRKLLGNKDILQRLWTDCIIYAVISIRKVTHLDRKEEQFMYHFFVLFLLLSVLGCKNQVLPTVYLGDRFVHVGDHLCVTHEIPVHKAGESLCFIHSGTILEVVLADGTPSLIVTNNSSTGLGFAETDECLLKEIIVDISNEVLQFTRPCGFVGQTG